MNNKKTLLSALLTVVFACFGIQARAATQTFEIFEDFDNPEHFTQSQTLPEGWKSEGSIPFTRATGSSYGIPPKSGSYVFATVSNTAGNRNETVYTPMMNLAAGKPCNISFYVYAPGGTPVPYRGNQFIVKAGTAQEAAAQTIAVGETAKQGFPDWTQLTYSFTPETDGEYCFSISVTSTTSSCGTVGMDDFEITGESPVAETPSSTFEIFEDFDNPEHFTQSQTLPDGWKSEGSIPFTRATGTSYGIPPKSGSYVFATVSNTAGNRNETVYTPMMNLAAGKPCNISFYVYAPGGTPVPYRGNQFIVKAGTAQEAAAQTIAVGETAKQGFPDWTQLTYSFTPETDGEYCFSISVTSTTSSCGTVGMDNFEITGESPAAGTDPADPVLEPDPENEADALTPPYLESFDNENDNYDGTTYIPTGWFATGNIPFFTANDNSLPAHTGTYYLITTDSQDVRNERLYTPFVMLEANKEYTMSFYVHMDPGMSGSNSTLDVTVGTQQEADFHKGLLKIENYSNDGWELREVKFTPEIAGAYCFSFALSSEAAYSGFVAIDDVLITAEGMVLKPQAAFCANHIYDINTSEMIVYSGQSVKMTNQSKYATDYEWSIIDNDNAIISDATAAEPEITFGASGTYTVKLVASNTAGERSAFREFKIEYIDGTPKSDYGICPNAPDDAQYSRGMLPTFDSSETDFITGPNKYYRKIAERFALSEDVEVSFKTVNIALTNLHYKIKDNNRDEQLNAIFNIVVYGETDGRLDETKELGRFSGAMKDVLGSSGIGASWGEFRNVAFDEPVKVKGNCYLAIEYDDILDIVVDDPNVGATYVGLMAVKHASEVSTLYVKPTALPETSPEQPGNWMLIDKVDPTLKGFGLWATVWVDSKDSNYTGIAINSAGETVFAVRVSGDDIIVSGTQAGETVRVYNAAGAVVASAVATGESTTIHMGKAVKGVYVVKAGAGAKKFVM